jgi:hypothetical protein
MDMDINLGAIFALKYIDQGQQFPPVRIYLTVSYD